jgi:hypothetical protein
MHFSQLALYGLGGIIAASLVFLVWALLHLLLERQRRGNSAVHPAEQRRMHH